MAQKDSTQFVTTWKTDNNGTSNDSSILIFIDTNYSYNYDVDWNDDGVFDSLNVTTSIAHQYAGKDTVTIRIRGEFPRVLFGGNVSNDNEKLMSIDQWGTTYWKDMSFAFYRCKNMVLAATDRPKLDSTKNMRSMFAETDSFNGSIGNWKVDSIRNMSDLFSDASAFNQDIGNWNVSCVTNMSTMFRRAAAFNQDISSWNVSAVTNMSDMFFDAVVFNQPIGSWDVSNVAFMSSMFRGAIAFNQDISSWDVSSVIQMNSLFENAVAFNQPIGSWDVSNVSLIFGMFRNASAFNQPLNNWQFDSAIVDLSSMFRGATAFNQPLDQWDVSHVSDMKGMFDGAVSFNQPLNNWQVGSVTRFGFMFEDARSFNQPLNNWDITSAQNIAFMFSNAISFNQNLGYWDISNIRNMRSLLDSTALTIANYDSTLISWQSKPHMSFGVLGAANLKYCDADSVRNLLINSDSWSIIGDTIDCQGTNLKNIESIASTFTIYPNPSNGYVNLSLEKINFTNQKLFIYNSTGKIVLSLNPELHQIIDLSGFSKGIYFIRYQNQMKKLVLLE